MIREHRFDDREELATKLATSVAGGLRRALAESSRVTLVVSGGSTPTPFFRALRQIELAWDRITITLADERWVDPSHADSNERLVRRELLRERAAAASFVGLKSAASTPESAGAELGEVIGSLRPFAVVVLGMGTDGHFASLFPGAPNLGKLLDPELEDSVVAVHPSASPWPRLTLTLSALFDSERLFLHITGKSKWSTYRRAKAQGPTEDLPLRALLSLPLAAEKLDVYWAP